LSVGTINDVINRGSKVVKEKKALLNELTDLNTKMQIVDNLLCLQLVEPNQDEKKAWQFFQENADQIIEIFPKLSATELVILDFCKNIGNTVLEKMSICRKNWTSLGSQLTSKSPSVSSLVNGPIVTPDLLTANKNLIPLTAETRATLLNVVAGIKKKVNNNSAGYVKSLMNKEDTESYNFIVNDLEVLIGKQHNKTLLPEEKLYIGYHLSKVRPYVSKIADLNTSKLFWKVTSHTMRDQRLAPSQMLGSRFHQGEASEEGEIVQEAAASTNEVPIIRNQEVEDSIGVVAAVVVTEAVAVASEVVAVDSEVAAVDFRRVLIIMGRTK